MAKSRSIALTSEGLAQVRQRMAELPKPHDPEKKRWSQDDLAECACLGKKTIQRALKPEPVDRETIILIANALHLDPATLVDPSDWNAETAAKSSVSLEQWQSLCKKVLKEKRQPNINELLRSEGTQFDVDDLFIPLGLVEKKQTRVKQRDIKSLEKPQKDDVSPEQGSQLYEPQPEEIVRRFDRADEFFETVIQGERWAKSRIIIIGEPGAGKTTLLQKIADQLPDHVLPVWVSLADLQGLTLDEYLFKGAWWSQADKTLSLEAGEEFRQLFTDGRVCLLLDGVDEMTVPENQKGRSQLRVIYEQVKGWGDRVRVIMTCRVNVWEADPFFSEFEMYRNLPLEYPEQVEQYIDNFFSNPNLSVQSGEELKQELLNNYRVQDTIKNPLRLALLCNSWLKCGGKLTERKAQLYEMFLQTFYEIKKEQFYVEPSQQDMLNQALGQLALEALDREQSRYRIDRSTAEKILGHPEQPGSYFYQALELGLLNKIGYLAEDPSQECYAFIHPTFQEYLAALAIDDWDFFLPREHGNEGNNLAPVKGKVYRIFEARWKEVYCLWMGCYDSPQAVENRESFLQAIINFYGDFQYCEEFHTYRLLYLGAIGIRELRYKSAKAQEIIYFSISVQRFYEWKNNDSLTIKQELMRQALQETDIDLGTQVIESEIDSIARNNQITEEESNAKLQDLLLDLNKINPFHPIVIALIKSMIRNGESFEYDLIPGEEENDYARPLYFPYDAIEIAHPEIIDELILVFKDAYEAIPKVKKKDLLISKLKEEKKSKALKNRQDRYEKNLELKVHLHDLLDKSKHPEITAEDRIIFTGFLESVEKYLDEYIDFPKNLADTWAIVQESLLNNQEEEEILKQVGLDNKQISLVSSSGRFLETLIRLSFENNSKINNFLIDLLKSEIRLNQIDSSYLKITSFLIRKSSVSIQELTDILVKILQENLDSDSELRAAKALLMIEPNSQKALDIFLNISPSIEDIKELNAQSSFLAKLADIAPNHPFIKNLYLWFARKCQIELEKSIKSCPDDESLYLTKVPCKLSDVTRRVRAASHWKHILWHFEQHYFIAIQFLTKVGYENQEILDFLIILIDFHYRKNLSIGYRVFEILQNCLPKQEFLDKLTILFQKFSNRKSDFGSEIAFAIIDIQPDNYDAVKYIIDWYISECISAIAEIPGTFYLDEFMENKFKQKSLVYIPLLKLLSIAEQSEIQYFYWIFNIIDYTDHENEIIDGILSVIHRVTDRILKCHLAALIAEIDINRSQAIDMVLEYLDTNDKSLCKIALREVGFIANNNQKAISKLVNMLEDSDKQESKLILEQLGRIAHHDLNAVKKMLNIFKDNFSDFTQEKPYSSLAGSAYKSLKQVLESNESNSDICRLVVRELQEIYSSDVENLDRCFNLLWLCSQQLNYPEFYQAWYGKPSTHPEVTEIFPLGDTSQIQQLDRQFFNLQDKLKSTDTTYLLCLDLSSLKTLKDAAAICQELATLSYETIDPNFETLDIPENIQNPAQLKTILIKLRKHLKTQNSNLKTLALVLHKSDPTPELVEIFDVLSSSFSIAWITDQPHPYRSFLPTAENLPELIQTWLMELD